MAAYDDAIKTCVNPVWRLLASEGGNRPKFDSMCAWVATTGGNYLDHVCRLHTALSNPQLMHRIAHDFHVLLSPLLFSPSISNLRRPMWRSL